VKPAIQRHNGRIEFYWTEPHVYALVRRIKEHSSGAITAELEFKTDQEDMPSHILHTQLNLLAARSKKELSKELDEILPADWGTMVEQLSVNSIQLYRQGDPPKEIWSDDVVPDPAFIVRPFLYEHKPNIIFGEGGTGKSYFALSLALLATLPFTNNPLNLPVIKARPLYLDYESDEDEISRRLSSLVKGFNLPQTPILYRNCKLPLSDEIEEMENIICENKVDLVIVDSLGVASANGNLNDASTATIFFSALRKLNVTSLIITHTSKESSNHSAFGSVYFTNLARSIWEFRKQQEEGETTIDIGLFHRKNNQGRLFPPAGFSLTFEDGKTTIKREDVRTVPEFLENLGLKAKIADLLKEGKLSVEKIANDLGVGINQVRTRLYEMRRNGKVVRIDDEWGLKGVYLE